MNNYFLSVKVLVLWLISFSLFAQTGVPRIVINPGGHSGKIYNILFTPDDEKIISVSEDKTIRVWNASTGEPVEKYGSQIGNGYQGMLYASTISPDGKYLAVAGYPVVSEKKNYIVIIDLETSKQVATAIGHDNVINSLDFNGTGQYLASGSNDGTVLIWKVDGKEKLDQAATLEIGVQVTGVSFNNKTQQLAVAADTDEILLYNMKGLSSGIKKFPSQELKKHKGIINRVAFSPDGVYLASSSYDNELFLWKSDGSFYKELDGLDNIINALSFSYDSKVLVSMDAIGNGISYSIPSGSEFSRFNGHDNTVFSADFSPASAGGNYVVASAGGNENVIQIWNAINGRSKQSIKGKGSTIWDLQFGKGFELFVNRKQSKEGSNEKFHQSFDFNTFSLKDDPGKPSGSFALNSNDVRQTGIYTLAVNRGGDIENSEFDDGRILDYTQDRKSVV